MQLPQDDRFLMTRSQLLDRIRGMLGGRAAEEVVFQEVTTGAENDLEHATALARQMVCLFGMSETVGLARCAQKHDGMLLPGVDGTFQRDCSEQTAQLIDAEVKKILAQGYAEATEILSSHRDQLELVTQKLLENETLDAAAFQSLIGVSPAHELGRLNQPLENHDSNNQHSHAE
jgi:cell division protease FtsH